MFGPESLVNFTGIDSPYERPEEPELTIDTSTGSVADCAHAVIDALESRGLIG